MVVVPGEVVLVYEQVVIAVQLPELAVDHVEVLVTGVDKKQIYLKYEVQKYKYKNHKP